MEGFYEDQQQKQVSITFYFIQVGLKPCDI